MRRCGVCAVEDLEGICARSGGVLRHYDDVAELESGHAQSAVGRGHVLTGEVAIGGHHFLVFLRAERLLHPSFIIFLLDQLRVAGLHKLSDRALGIDPEDGALLHDHLLQLAMVGGQVVHLVTLVFESLEEVIERRSDLHAAGRHGCALALPLEVINGHALLAVGLGAEVEEALHGFDERLEAFGHGEGVAVAVLVFILGKECCGTYGAVDLGHGDALRHEAAGHAHRVVLPILHEAIDGERCEHRHVVLPEPIDHLVAQAAVRHVDHHGGVDGVEVVEPFLAGVDGIDVHARLLQRIDQAGGVGHLSGDDDFMGALVPEVLLLEPGLIIGHGVELEVVVAVVAAGVGVIDDVFGALHGRLRLVDEEAFAVDHLADVVEQAAIVLLAAAVEVGLDGVAHDGVEVADVVVGVCGHRGVDGHSLVGQALQLFALLLDDAQAHAVDEDHVEAFELVELVGGDFYEFDVRVVVGFVDAAKRDGLIVHEGHACGCHPFGISKKRRGQDDCDDPNPQINLPFHSMCSYGASPR